MVPELPGCEASISFLNHFLIKRGYKRIGCRITAVDAAGSQIGARLIQVDEPRVYTIRLAELFKETASTYLIDFYAAENLFIPFPAVMINHRGERFFNTVHSYNRVLNDIFENDQINKVHVSEAAIDVRVDDETDTFLNFAGGPLPLNSQLEFNLHSNGEHRNRVIDVSMPRFTNRIFSVREIFPDFVCSDSNAILKVTQPEQFMFYGRLLAGIRNQYGEFSANHSYYDNSIFAEYWDDGRPSFSVYPFLPSFDTRIRFYPIMSPSTLELEIGLHGKDGQELRCVNVGNLTSPGSQMRDIGIGNVAASQDIDPTDIQAFCVYATSQDGRTPTRVNHQLVYDAGALTCSINASLANENVYMPAGKTGRTWGQAITGGGFNSWVGLYGQNPSSADDSVELILFDSTGQIGEHHYLLPSGGSVILDMAELVGDSEELQFLWFTAKSARSDLKAMVVSRSLLSLNCSGEHGF